MCRIESDILNGIKENNEKIKQLLEIRNAEYKKYLKRKLSESREAVKKLEQSGGPKIIKPKMISHYPNCGKKMTD